MFENFYIGSQQDLKLIIIPAIICTLLRIVFIKIYGDKSIPEYDKNTKHHYGSDFFGDWISMPMYTLYHSFS